MAVSVVDTSVLIARADLNDPYNEVATGIFEGIDHGDLPTGRVTNYVVLETLNWIHTRQRHGKAVEFRGLMDSSAGYELVHAAQADFARTTELFETYDRLAFGDATIVAYMEREGIEYLYSFDDDFDAIEGITRLETVENPFA